MPDVYTSNWVGLDGFNDQTVEQDGTSATCKHGTGFETPTTTHGSRCSRLPTVREFHVAPGDVISASVAYYDGRQLHAHRHRRDYRATKSVVDTCATCERASAEWIIERPAGCDPLPDQLLPVRSCELRHNHDGRQRRTVQGGTPTGLASLPHAHQIFMVQATRKGGFYALDNVSG